MRKQKEFLIDVSDYSGAQVVDNDAFFTRDTDAYLIFRPTNTYINYDSALLYLANLSNGAILLDLPTTKIDDSYLEFKLTPDILEAYGAWKGQILFQLDGSIAASSSFEFTVNRFLTDSRPANPVEIVTIDRLREEARKVMNEVSESLDRLSGINTEWITPTLLNGATGEVRYRINIANQLELAGAINIPTNWNVGLQVFKFVDESYIPMRISHANTASLYTDRRMKFRIPIDGSEAVFASISGYNDSFYVGNDSRGKRLHINLVIPLF